MEKKKGLKDLLDAIKRFEQAKTDDERSAAIDDVIRVARVERKPTLGEELSHLLEKDE